MALTQETYREILYDLLFLRPEKAINGYLKKELEGLSLLKDFFLQNKNRVIGLGNRIGKFWIADD